jgi:curli biogenesis system outer membrane secretion channel CsgG
MADMLNDALLQSNRFVVLDRQALKDVLEEQKLVANGRVTQETAAPIGQIEGADLLIKGSVTEFEPGSAGARGGAGLGAFGLPGAVISGVLSGLRQSHVAMIIQVVDARTSRLLFSTTVEGKANDFDIGGFLAGFGGGFGAGAGLGMGQKTPIEKAIRIAILHAVKELSSKTPKVYFRYGAEAALPSSGLFVTQPRPQVTDVAVRQISSQSMKIPSRVTDSSGLPSSVKVKVSVANLRDNPGTQGKIVTTLKEGVKLSVQGEDKGYYFVQAEDGKEGWISKSLTVQ